MRAGWNTTLANRLHRADPYAWLFPEAVVETLTAVHKKKSDWETADSTTGFTLRDDGGVELTPSNTAVISHGSSDGNWTALDRRSGTFRVAKVSWLGSENSEFELGLITARLHPRVDGGAAKEVAYWELHVYTRVPAGYVTFSGDSLIEICQPVRIVASGTSEADYTFEFADRDNWIHYFQTEGAGASFAHTGPRPKSRPGLTDMYIEIRALTATGAVAGNVAWRKDSATASVTTSSNVLTGVELAEVSGAPGEYTETALSETPRLAIQRYQVSGSTTLTFGTTALDLGDTPSGLVEFRGAGLTPGGSSFTFQVRNDADSDWVTFTDGQTNEDVGVSARQTYKMRVTFTAGGSDAVSPVLREFGAVAITRESFDGLASVEGAQGAVDPVTLKGEIAACRIRAIRDGEPDFRDAITTLLSSYNIGQITWRIWVGAPDLDRQYWLLIDTFLTDEVATEPDGSVTVHGISPLSLIKTHLPVYQGDPETDLSISSITRSGTTATVTAAAAHGFTVGQVGLTVVIEGANQAEYNGAKRITVTSATVFTFDVDSGATTPATGTITYYVPQQVTALRFNQQTIQDVCAAIVDDHIGLPARYRGQLIADDTTRVSKLIQDSEAKAELDALHWLWGGGLISSQGRLQSRSLYAARNPVAVLPWEELAFGSVSPGWSHRKPQIRVAYDWDFTYEVYRREVRAFNATALSAMGQPWGDLEDVDERITQWLISVPITSITRSSSTVTVTTTYDHGLVTGQTVTIIGATGDGAKDEPQGGYNGDVEVTVTGSNTFTYTCTGTPTSPATGDLFCAITPHLVANRVVQAMGAGRVEIPFAVKYAHPEWEIGDVIAIQTDRIIARDPFGGRALKGRLWVIGVIEAVHDLIGTQFTLFVRSFADMVSGTEAATRLGFALPEVLDATPEGEPDGVVRAVIRTRDAGSVRVAVSTSDYPTAATVRAEDPQAVNTEGTLATGTLDTLAEDETLYGSVLAYENVDGTGAESAKVAQFKIKRVAAVEKVIMITHDQFRLEASSYDDPTVEIEHTGFDSVGGQAFLTAALPMPEGVTLTELFGEVRSAGALTISPFTESGVGLSIYRLEDDATSTLIGDVNQTNVGASWVTLTDALNELVDAGYRYKLRVDLSCIPEGADQLAQFTGVGVRYTAPSQYETY